MTSSTATLPVGAHADAPGRSRRLLRAAWRGRATDAAWVRPSLLGLLLGTAVLYLWNLSVNGYSNSFYSAAVQAGSKSWEAFFFGSSDWGNSITVDKPPASLWVMELSVRLFGLNSEAILVPEALMGVASVWLVYAIVRRHFRPGAALLAGASLTLTPIAALMFRFNNPDALLVLLYVLSVYFLLRAVESGRVRWLAWAGVAIGIGFLTKQLQAVVILPVLAGVYLWMAPVRMRTRLWHLLVALGAFVVSAGWWVAIVELVPAGMRPYIGGSQTNDFLELTFGYNGFGRLTGDETGSVTGGTTTATAGSWGETGITRLFSSTFGGQISWLIPAALILAGVGIGLLWRAPRTDPRRAALVLFTGWLLVMGLAFSFAQGIVHPYYSFALAPAIAGMVGIGGSLLWERRDALWARVVAAVTILLTVGWAFLLLGRSSDWLPWLRWSLLLVGLLAAALLLLADRSRPLARAALVAVLVAGLGAPLAFSIDTVLTGHTGAIPSAGPTTTGGGGGGGFTGGAGRGGGQAPSGTAPSGRTGATGGTGTGTTGGFPGGTGGTTGGRRGGGTGGGGSSLLGGSSASSAVVTLLESGASDYRWAAATVGSDNAASYQLAADASVMPIGGFNGSDPSPTLAQFKAYAAAGDIHYYIASGTITASNGGSDISATIQDWVESHYTAKTVGGVTVYDLTVPASASASTATPAPATSNS